jgi:hypothetical protein
MEQAKINVKSNERYNEAQEILRLQNVKEFIPRSPSAWNKAQYGKKGATIFITTALSTVALTQAILAFDWMSMLTYLFTIVMGLIFGVLQMKTAEEYWTDEFWQYAQQIKKAQEESKRKAEESVELAKEEHIQQGNDTTSNTGGTTILEPTDSVYSPSTSSEPVVVGCTWDSIRSLGRNSTSNSDANSTNLRTW